MYWPLRYTLQVKHPRQKFVRRLIQEDGMLWILATVWLSSAPLYHVPALLLLLFSFWCVYEQGYVENDRYAMLYEGDLGNVPVNYQRLPSWEPWAWLWAISLAGAGIGILQYANSGNTINGLQSMAGWLAMLIFTRAAFRVYNMLEPPSRRPFYLVLQACRSLGVAAAVPASAVGVLALSAHTLARSLPYYVYRRSLDGRAIEWPQFPVFSIRLTILLFLLIADAAGRRDASAGFSLEALAILLWCVFRARRELSDLPEKTRLLETTHRD